MPIGKSNDPYIDNVELSQNRSRNVLKYLRSLDCYRNLSVEKVQLLQFLLTANGLSYGRTLDVNKHLSYISQQPIDKEKSRRVEFRIVTTSELLVERVIDQISK